jgi:hypothetical protein
MVGGSLLLNSIRSMMGGQRQGIADSSAMGDKPSSPLSDQSGSTLARDAGIDDLGSSAQRGNDNSRAGLFDTADNADNNDTDNDNDDDDHDSDGFDDDGGGDYA